MSVTPIKETSEAKQGKHEGDIIGSLHIILVEIETLKQGQKDIAKQIGEQIDTKINTLRDELKQEITTRIDHSETYVMNECLLINNQIQQLTETITQQAKEIEQLKICAVGGDTDPLKNTDVTVVVSGLPVYPQENPVLIAEDLVTSLGSDSNSIPINQQVKVVKAARLPQRQTSKPPLMKISFRTLDEKKLVLANKRNLQHTVYSKIFMRSSKSHEVRLIEMNTRTILQNSPLGNTFRLNAMGKMVPKDGYSGEQRRPRLPERNFSEPPSNSSRPSFTSRPSPRAYSNVVQTHPSVATDVTTSVAQNTPPISSEVGGSSLFDQPNMNLH